MNHLFFNISEYTFEINVDHLKYGLTYMSSFAKLRKQPAFTPGVFEDQLDNLIFALGLLPDIDSNSKMLTRLLLFSQLCY